MKETGTRMKRGLNRSIVLVQQGRGARAVLGGEGGVRLQHLEGFLPRFEVGGGCGRVGVGEVGTQRPVSGRGCEVVGEAGGAGGGLQRRGGYRSRLRWYVWDFLRRYRRHVMLRHQRLPLHTRRRCPTRGQLSFARRRVGLWMRRRAPTVVAYGLGVLI